MYTRKLVRVGNNVVPSRTNFRVYIPHLGKMLDFSALLSKVL